MKKEKKKKKLSPVGLSRKSVPFDTLLDSRLIPGTNGPQSFWARSRSFFLLGMQRAVLI